MPDPTRLSQSEATEPHEFATPANPYKSALKCAICGVARYKHPTPPKPPVGADGQPTDAPLRGRSE